jgi:hypothetical protein
MIIFERLNRAGFQVELYSHAAAILQIDFPDVVQQLEDVLLGATIPIEEIIAGGGGEAKGTQRLRRGLSGHGWLTKTFTIVKTINGIEREAITHKMDHVREFTDQSGKPTAIALETEWNNKDPFFDRDLENFKRLHADGAISVGIVITRGRSLHANMRDLVRRFCDERQIQTLEDLAAWGYHPTTRQKNAIIRRVERHKNPITFREAFVDRFVADKFGEATTHWRKLEDRVHRGVGNPCPLVLIGLPDSIVTFGEDPGTVHSLLREAEQAEYSAD